MNKKKLDLLEFLAEISPKCESTRFAEFKENLQLNISAFIHKKLEFSDIKEIELVSIKGVDLFYKRALIVVLVSLDEETFISIKDSCIEQYGFEFVHYSVLFTVKMKFFYKDQNPVSKTRIYKKVVIY